MSDGGPNAEGGEAISHFSLPSDASSSKLVGCRIGDYQILRKLGRGGMADVYAARQISLSRDVAMKVLRSDFARDQDYVSRFRREAKAAAKLNHPNIVGVHDVGSENSYHYIAQELVDGENLREVLSKRGSLSVDEAIEVLACVASALEVAAEAGITHRDIKPENMMRSSKGIVKVADFGLARLSSDVDATRANLTQAGLTLGTPRYMSPEQIQGQNVDVRSDLYSLGISIYHLLAGRPPFEADDPLALAVMHLHETPPPLDRLRGSSDVPEWLVAIVARLMSKRPEDRFQTPSDLLAAVSSQAADAGFGGIETVGTAAATIRLQRIAAYSVKKNRQRYLRYALAFLIPLIAATLAVAVAATRPFESVDNLLRPKEVAKAESVEKQYLVAMTRNDEAGWLAVAAHFAPEANSENANYYAKASLQHARLLSEKKQWKEADEKLDRLIADPKTSRLYRTIALAFRCLALEKSNRNGRLTEVRSDLQNSYKDLKSTNQEAAELFDRVVPTHERVRLGLAEKNNVANGNS